MGIEQGDYVRLTKLGIVDDPYLPTPSWDEYIPGKHQPGLSVPVEYTVTGQLVTLPKEGRWVLVARDTRNGAEVTGILNTSVVKGIDEVSNTVVEFHTMNSRYRLEKIEKVIISPPQSERSESGEGEWSPLN